MVVLDPTVDSEMRFSITIHEAISEVSFTGSGLTETGRTTSEDDDSVTIRYSFKPENPGSPDFVFSVTSEDGDQLQFRIVIVVLPPGDANGDHCSDMRDYVVFDQNFGQAVAFGPLQGDFNSDGRVSIFDFPVFLNGFNNNNCDDQPV